MKIGQHGAARGLQLRRAGCSGGSRGWANGTWSLRQISAELDAAGHRAFEALRLYARMQAPEPGLFKVERWDWKDSHVEEIIASASLVMIGRAAFAAAVEEYPGTWLTLRRGAMVIDQAG